MSFLSHWDENWEEYEAARKAESKKKYGAENVAFRAENCLTPKEVERAKTALYDGMWWGSPSGRRVEMDEKYLIMLVAALISELEHLSK